MASQWMKNPCNCKQYVNVKVIMYAMWIFFFAIGCFLSLVQGDYRVCSRMCPLQLKFCLLQLKLYSFIFQIYFSDLKQNCS